MNQIRWTKSDSIRLGKAIASFNKKIRSSLESDEILPELREFNQVKENILTRRELNNVLNSLKRFKEEGATNVIQLEGGEYITKWEYEELKKRRAIELRRLNKEYRELEKVQEGQVASRIQMGSNRAEEIKARIESLKKLEMQKGYKFRMKKESIYIQGRSDIKLMQAKVWRENFIKEFEKYKNLEGYKIFVNEMNKIKNPIKFFEKFGGHELYGDLHYDSTQNFTQSDFNKLLEAFGISFNENEETI